MILKDSSFILNLGIFGLFIFPFALLTGPFLPDLIISLEALLFLIICFKNNNWTFVKTPFFKIYITFYLIIVLSSFLSLYPYQSLKASLPHIRFFFFASIISLLVNNYKNFNIIYFKITFFILIFIFIDACYQYFFGLNIFGIISSQPGKRVSSVFGEELILGSYVMKLFPICLAFLFTIGLDKKKLNFNIFLLFSISLIIILFSGDRVPLLLYVIFTLILFLSFSFIKYKFRFFLLFNLIILSVIIIFFNPNSFDRIITSTNQNLIKESEGSKSINIIKNLYFYSNVHENYMKISINMFKDKPILGQGPNTFRYLCDDEKFSIIEKDTNLICSTHPHNTYIQLLAEAGIFSMLIFLIVFILSILFLLKIRKKNRTSKLELIASKIVMTASMIIIFFPLLPSGNIFNNRLNCFMYFCIGFYIYFKKIKIFRHE
jgi:O-antigen ligase